MRLPLAEFAPDAPKTGTGFSSSIRNVLPGELGSYIPARAKAALSAALAAQCRGAVAFQTQTGSWRIVAATLTAFYILNGTDYTWDAAGTTGTGPDNDENWSFDVFNGYLYATNVNDGLYRLEVEAGTTFAAVAGSPPKAKYVAAVDHYLMLGGLADAVNGVAWCDTDDPTNWTTGNSDEQDFPNNKQVLAICPEAERILQLGAEQVMIRQPGSSVVFIFQSDTMGKGTIAPQSVIKVGSAVAALAEDGFYLRDGQGAPVKIGAGKVDRWFFDTANTDRLFSVQGAYDPLRGLMRWAFHTGDGAAYDWQLVYSPTVNRWAPVVDNTTFLLTIATPAITLGGIGALYATLTDVPYPFGSRVWAGGRPTFGVFGSDDILGFYEGDALAATLETAEVELAQDRRCYVNGFRPVVEGDTAAAVTGAIKYRGRLQDSQSTTSNVTIDADGNIPVLAEGRYFQASMSIPAGTTWTSALGVDIADFQASRRGRY